MFDTGSSFSATRSNKASGRSGCKPRRSRRGTRGSALPRFRVKNPSGTSKTKSASVPRATFYRCQRPAPGHQQPRPTPARALCASERAHVLDVLASPRFVDRSPAEVVATRLDEGQYLCAERTMYRILAANQPVRERRNQRSHPCYTKPELVATGPNQTWSWDITRLRGPKRWTSFYLYVLLDIFSRCVVGWMVADRENAALAATLIEETCLKQRVLRQRASRNRAAVRVRARAPQTGHAPPPRRRLRHQAIRPARKRDARLFHPEPPALASR